MGHSPDDLFDHNRAWAARRLAEDPGFFARLCGLQAPDFLWIGCADSRVPANEIVGLDPGELFVHRNVANLVDPADINALAVLQYAVDALAIRHVIVCGHYGCGGVQAAMGPRVEEPLERWLAPLRRLYAAHRATLAPLPEAERWRRLCELNVAAQVGAVADLPVLRAAWARGQPLAVHGWIYDLADGLLRDLGVSVSGPAT